MPYIDLILVIESALRETIVVWKDDEYMAIAEKIAKKIKGVSDVRI